MACPPTNTNVGAADQRCQQNESPARGLGFLVPSERAHICEQGSRHSDSIVGRQSVLRLNRLWLCARRAPVACPVECFPCGNSLFCVSPAARGFRCLSPRFLRGGASAVRSRKYSAYRMAESTRKKSCLFARDQFQNAGNLILRQTQDEGDFLFLIPSWSSAHTLRCALSLSLAERI